MPRYTDSITERDGFSPRRIGALSVAVVILIVLVASLGKLVENLGAGEVMVIQSLGGQLNCYTNPGPYWQGFGDVTKYPRQSIYLFDTQGVKPGDMDNGKELQFNDGGKAHLYGSVNWEMPIDCASIITLHKQFNSPEGIVQRGVAKMVNSAVYLSGPMMSSTESAAERRSELTDLINDQAQRGVYHTITRTVEKPDPITGEKRQVNVVEILRDDKGLPRRQQGSILEQYGIHLQPISIEKLKYSTEVENQIAERQKATQQVQLAQANARKAEQDAITTAKQGEAIATSERWKQEAIKARYVTEAQQKLEVATLSAKEAEQYKREKILRGEGEAQYKQLVMAADGALDQKLQAYIRVQGVWADAFSKYGGAMVPSVQMGGGGGSNTAMSNTQTLVDLLTAKTAKDLSLDLTTVGQHKPVGPSPK